MTLDEYLREEHEEAYKEAYEKAYEEARDDDIRKLLKRMTIEQTEEILEIPVERVQKISDTSRTERMPEKPTGGI